MKVLYFIISVCLNLPSALAEDKVSFAQEYFYLSKLLESVTDRNSAISYKPEISKELNRLHSSQASGGEQFSSLSEKDQKLFIQKFQNNRNHCRYVTKVMEERKRILLNHETRVELESVLLEIP